MVIMRSKLKNEKLIFFLPFLDWKHGPLEQKAIVLPISHADPLNYTILLILNFSEIESDRGKVKTFYSKKALPSLAQRNRQDWGRLSLH